MICIERCVEEFMNWVIMTEKETNQKGGGLIYKACLEKYKAEYRE